MNVCAIFITSINKVCFSAIVLIVGRSQTFTRLQGTEQTTLNIVI